MQRSFGSFIKNGKERKDRSVLLKRTGKNARTLRSFEKKFLVEICLLLGGDVVIYWWRYVGFLLEMW